nr:calmodulin-regulated spectrin-associated protein 1 isoform X1 [Parasteatoda tepidariorum]
MFYYSNVMPYYGYVHHPVRQKPSKKTRVHLHPGYTHKKKRFSLAYYLKYVLWKKIRRFWKKRRNRSKKKKTRKPPSAVTALSNRGSDEKIDMRDFWGSKYGSQWLFAKQNQLQQVNHNHLVELVDAFKTMDLKYAKKNIPPGNQIQSDPNMVPTRFQKSKSNCCPEHSCPCSRKQKRRTRKDGLETEGSEWSLSTLQVQQKPYSKWPPHPPPGARHYCGKDELLATVPSRQHAYVYNWLYVDQIQSRCNLPLSREYLDQVKSRLSRSPRSKRKSRRQDTFSQTSSSCSECSSTIGRRQKAKILKKQIRAREKASILWLLSKAFEGEIPSDLIEPFYRDQDNTRRLKPKIVHSLANAELYCLALVNIYADPNYHNLDHQGIVQVLTRKGVTLVESREAPLTETMLVQTAPIRLNAHMAVIDGIMSLYIKEVLIPEKIVEVVKKFSHVDASSEIPSSSEEAAVLWINKCCRSLEQEIRSECSPEEQCRLPKIPVLQDILDVSDGCCLAAVICYYCPNFFRWQDICWNDPMSLGDSIYNLQLVRRFCSECLPREINFLSLEDLLYLHKNPSLKENVLVFISDLLYMFVIFRASCVTQKRKNARESSHIPLENSKSLGSFQSHKNQNTCNPIPNLRSDSYGGSTSSLPDIRPGSRTKTYGSKERLCEKVLKKSNIPTEEMGPNQLQRTNSVGMVNGWKTTNLPHVNSTESVSNNLRHINPELTRLPAEGESASSHASQPSIGSIDEGNIPKNATHLPRTDFYKQNSPPRENLGYGFRKSSETGLHCYRSDGANLNGVQEPKKGRKSLEDYYNQLAGVDGPLRSISATNITDNSRWRNLTSDKSTSNQHVDGSVPESASSQSSGICLSDFDAKNNFSTTSFAQLSKLKDNIGNSINIVYMQHEKEASESSGVKSKSSRTDTEGKRTTFAALPNTTTWQQQYAAHSHFPPTDSGHETPTEPGDNMLNAQLCDIKMKLEEKKRKIELKKKRMEMLWKKQRQKLGKAAFLQAVSKTPTSEAGTPDSGTGKEVTEPDCLAREISIPETKAPTLIKRMSVQEIADDLDNVQKKWLNHNDISEQISLPDYTLDSADYNADSICDSVNVDLQTSIEHLTTSLTDLQADISRISLQQEQVENLMKDSIDEGSHFFLHSPSNDSSFESLPPAMSNHWRFNNEPQSRKPITPVDAAKFLPPPHHHDGHSLLRRVAPEYESHNFKSLPPSSVLPKAPEELYSKVIRPENRQRHPPMSIQNQVNERVPSSENIGLISREDYKKPSSKPKTTEIHVMLPQVPDSKSSDINSEKKVKDKKQGFYIPIESETKKTKPKSLKNLKAANNMNVNTVPKSTSQKNVPTQGSADTSTLGFVIGADLVHPDPETETEMARKKELIMNLSIQRKAEYERKRAEKEKEYARMKDEERRKQEYHERKRDEEKRRREAILEQYRQRKLREELEKEGNSLSKDVGKFAKPRTRREVKQRPKSAYVPMNSDLAALLSGDNTANKRISQIFPGRDMHDFDLDSLNSGSTDRSRSPNAGFLQNRNPNLQVPEGSGPSSDGASDTASNGSSAAAGDYTGPKLFVKPTAKSNRGIIMNAINTVLAGAVNSDTKKKVLEEINRSESKHFLILFRDAGCQFRALYTYNPEREEVTKLYGIGPKNIIDKMMDRFYKYNSGGKCFSEIQTKHLTVTIDAFTIPNSLWAGKKVVPPKKEFF